MVAHVAMEYVTPSLSNSHTATEEYCFYEVLDEMLQATTNYLELLVRCGAGL
jgi:hypothetical protein